MQTDGLENILTYNYCSFKTKKKRIFKLVRGLHFLLTLDLPCIDVTNKK